MILGAPIGRDNHQISAALSQILKLQSTDPLRHPNIKFSLGTHRPFFDALLSPDLPIQHSYLLTRFCGVPKLGYLSRVVRPSVLRNYAKLFEDELFDTAIRKLDISPSSAPNARILNEAAMQLRLPQRLGGFGLTPVTMIIDVAYVSSLAATIEYTTRREISLHSVSLKASQQLTHSCIQELRSALHEARCGIDAPHILSSLPKPADTLRFHSFFRPAPLSNDRTIPKSSHLQHVLIAAKQKAAEAAFRSPAVQRTDTEQKQLIARLNCVQAPRALLWSTTLPTESSRTLSDHAFKLAVRLALGLKPLDYMPSACPNCHEPISEFTCDHHLTCHTRTRKEITARHDNIVKIATAYANASGGSAVSEPAHLAESSRIRPDISVFLDDKQILVDVSVVHPTAASYINKAVIKPLAATSQRAAHKRRKYQQLCNAQRAHFVPFLVESYGGLSADAVEFINRITAFSNSIASQQQNALPLSGHCVLADIAIAIQRGNARAASSCYWIAAAG